jgi:hypothetical protein
LFEVLKIEDEAKNQMTAIFRSFLVGVSLLSFIASPVSAQRLISVSPKTGATGVAILQPVTFTFDVDMRPTNPFLNPSFWTSVPGTPGARLSNLYYHWTSARTFVVSPDANYGGFRKNSAIYWDLDPFGFISVSGKALQQGPQNTGSFTTSYQDMGYYRSGSARISMEKVSNYGQFAAATPNLSAMDPYAWFASVSAAKSRALTNVSFFNGGKETFFNPPVSSTTEFGIAVRTNSLSALNAILPKDYVPIWLRASGTTWTKLVFWPATNFPAAPFFSNYDAGQVVDASKDFEIQLGSGGFSTNRVQIRVRDPEGAGYVVETSSWDAEASLAGDVASLVIPAGTLQAGKTYEVEISRWTGRENTIADEDTTTLAAIGSTTLTQLKTAAQTTTIVLSNPSYGSGSFSLDATLTANQSYSLERSTNATTWELISSVFAVAPTQTFFDLTPPPTDAIYRVKKD